MRRRRESNSAIMRWASSSPFWIASRAAYCEGVGADMMMYWWIFIIASRSSAGAQAQPTRQPVVGHLGAGGIGGIAEEDRLAPVRQVGLHLLGAHPELRLHARGDGHERAAGDLTARPVGDVVGVGGEQLVARVEDRQQGQHQPL